MTKYQAIIFDMNGVIVDDEPLHLKADIITCKAFNLDVPSEEWPKIKGWKIQEIFTYYIDKYAKQKIDIDKIVKYKIKTYLELAKTEVETVTGVIGFVKLARQIFPKVALATSTIKELQEFVFKKFDLDEYFDIIVTAEDFDQGKPHPDAYLKAVQKLCFLPADCLVIEDSVNGVISGKSAGCTVLAVTTTYPREKLEEAGADFIFDSFQEVIDNIEKWK